jgi:hypothetical protein
MTPATPRTCPLTGITLTKYSRRPQVYPAIVDYQFPLFTMLRSYAIEYWAFDSWEGNGWFKRNKHLVKAAIYNQVLNFEPDEVIDIPLLKQRLESSPIPRTPKQRLDFIFRYISDKLDSPVDNFSVDVPTEVKGDVEVPRWDNESERAYGQFNHFLLEVYSKNKNEFLFYLRTLEKEGLIEVETRLNGNVETLFINVTYAGLSYLGELENAGVITNNCFIAMAFSEERSSYRTAIINAVEACGFFPIIIDNRDLDSDKTINDQIIAEIRRCKFCISDFTLQRNGVYFEAGFALGLGKPVIYVCEQEDFKNSHFDLKPFQHILYKSAEELQTGLIRKMGAWIK